MMSSTSDDQLEVAGAFSRRWNYHHCLRATDSKTIQKRRFITKLKQQQHQINDYILRPNFVVRLVFEAVIRPLSFYFTRSMTLHRLFVPFGLFLLDHVACLRRNLFFATKRLYMYFIAHNTLKRGPVTFAKRFNTQKRDPVTSAQRYGNGTFFLGSMRRTHDIRRFACDLCVKCVLFAHCLHPTGCTNNCRCMYLM